MKETALIEKPTAGAMIEVSSSRESQEVQAAVFMAKKFPRDLALVRQEVLDSCSYNSLAEASQYSYAKGGTEVTGASIRLAEALKSAYGNIDSGWIEVDRKSGLGNVPGESTIVAFAWDIQKNVRAKRVFTVRHWRDTKAKSYALKDERDIYELCANQASRRVRACILEIIPKHLQDEAIDKCDETMKKNLGPLVTRIQAMVAQFGKIGVTVEMLEKRLSHKIDAANETEIISLGKVFNSIKDGFGDKGQFFPDAAAAQPAAPVDNKTDVETPPAATVQSIKTVKNHAPQTSQDAKADQPAPAEPAPAKPDQPKAAAAKPGAKQPELSKARLTQEICALSREMGWDGATLVAKFQTLVSKQPGSCTAEELDDVLTIMKTEKVNATK